MDKNNKSFTLIEILVVSSIIAVLSGTSLALFSTYKNDRVLSGETLLFTKILELAKAKASAGDTSLCSSSSTAHVSGYSVDATSTQIVLQPLCDTTPSPQAYPIPTSIQIIPSSFSIQFTSQNYEGGLQTFVLKSSMDDSRCKLVTIEETGLITNGDTVCP